MTFLLWPFGALTSLLFTLLTYVLAPLLALLADKDGNLPQQLSWFQTFDASLDEGQKYGYTGSDWWVRTRWLWRNPGYTFDLEVLGVEWRPEEWTVHRPGPEFFFATSTRGAFNLCLQYPHFQLKLGWKAWNHWSGTDWNTPNWSGFTKLPICITVSR